MFLHVYGEILPLWPISSYQSDITECIAGNRGIPAGASWHEPTPYTTASNPLAFLGFEEEHWRN